DDLAGGEAAEEVALQQVLVRAVAGACDRGARAGGSLVCEEAFEHADRRVERGAHGAALGLAVPAAVGELLTGEPLEETMARLAEVAAERDGRAVDAGLHLAVEEGRVPVPRPPRHPLADALDRRARGGARGVDAELPQELQGVQRRLPRPRTLAPATVRELAPEELRSPALGGDPRALGGDALRGLAGEVAHHLPADRRIRVEQPLHGGGAGRQAVSLTVRVADWYRRFGLPSL